MVMPEWCMSVHCARQEPRTHTLARKYIHTHTHTCQRGAMVTPEWCMRRRIQVCCRRRACIASKFSVLLFHFVSQQLICFFYTHSARIEKKMKKKILLPIFLKKTESLRNVLQVSSVSIFLCMQLLCLY